MSLKQQILEGVRRVEKVHVPELESDGFDGWLPVRPLTDGEAAEATEVSVSGHTVSGEAGERPSHQQIDASKSAKGMARARQIRVAYGLSVDGEKWRPDEVAKLPSEAVRRIDAKVRELSGPGLEDDGAGEVASFRDGPAGSDDRDAASDGEPADHDAG